MTQTPGRSGLEPRAKRRVLGRRAAMAAAVIAAALAAAGFLRLRASDAARAYDALLPLPPDLPPLPPGPERLARPAEKVRASYEFAGRHPEVLRYIPCYCGCEKLGHGGADDCFVRARDAEGRPKWDAHAMSCGICIDIAWKARQMHAAGATVAAIRRAVHEELGSERETQTPTEPPPGS